MLKKNKILILPLVVLVLDIILMLGIFLLYLCIFAHPYMADWESVRMHLLLWGVVPLSAVAYVVTYLIALLITKKLLKNKLSEKARIALNKTRIGLTITVTVLLVIAMVLQLWILPNMLIFISPIGSRTTDVEDYLVVDYDVEDYWSDSYEFFPEEIPKSAQDVHYFYRFRMIVEEDFDIYLKMTLPEEDFAKEKDRIEKSYPDAEIFEAENGAIEYRIKYEDSGGYYYKFVVFAESDLTIEYVSSHSLEGYSVGNVPYFKEIER